MIFIIFILLFASFVECDSVDHLFSQIDPSSIKDNLYFYEQHPNHPKAKLALNTAFNAMGISSQLIENLIGPENHFSSLTSLAWLQNINEPLDPQLLKLIKNSLKHTILKGHTLLDYRHILEIPENQVDISRLLLSYEFDKMENKKSLIENQEAILDIMALQIKASCTDPNDKMLLYQSLIQYIFVDNLFEFPALSDHLERIGSYSWISSTIDQRKGVCLGLTTLVLSLAQRLGLSIYPVTIPGHIFAQFRPKAPYSLVNIETTCRGVHFPSKKYYSLSSSKLNKPTNKEVLLLTIVNQSSEFLRSLELDKAIDLYREALQINPKHNLTNECLSFALAAKGDFDQAKLTLKSLLENKQSISSIDLAEDILLDRINAQAMEILISLDNKNYTSIVANLEKLKDIHKDNPESKSILQAIIFSAHEIALAHHEHLYHQKLAALKPKDPSTIYYFCHYEQEHGDYRKALYWLNRLKQHAPKPHHESIYHLEHQLVMCCPIHILKEYNQKNTAIKYEL